MGFGHAWGDAWLSFDGVNKVVAKSLTLEIQSGNEKKGTGSCYGCDSVSADMRMEHFSLSWTAGFTATVEYCVDAQNCASWSGVAETS